MTAFFEQPGSRWFNIPAHRPFVEDLAQGLYDALSPLGPQALADAVVLTPTRRGARALADAFVRAAGGRAVLPGCRRMFLAGISGGGARSSKAKGGDGAASHERPDRDARRALNT